MACTVESCPFSAALRGGCRRRFPADALERAGGELPAVPERRGVPLLLYGNRRKNLEQNDLTQRGEDNDVEKKTRFAERGLRGSVFFVLGFQRIGQYPALSASVSCADMLRGQRDHRLRALRAPPRGTRIAAALRFRRTTI